MNRQVTSADVARAAGLSRTTVSYILNDTPGTRIPDETRERVLRTARELGYVPSAAGRALRRGRSSLVLNVTPNFPGSPDNSVALAREMTRAFARQGLTLVNYLQIGDEGEGREIWSAVAPVAVITFDRLNEGLVAELLAAGVHIVGLSLGPDDAADRLVSPEWLAGAAQAQHLIERGFRKIAYAYPSDPGYKGFAESRLEGVRDACQAAGLPAPDVRTVALEPAGAEEALGSWRGAVTGVCAYNDDHAIAIMSAAQRAGVRLPQDLAVIGLDDTIASRLVTPRLTTLKYDLEAIAEAIAVVVHARILQAPEPAIDVDRAAWFSVIQGGTT